MAKKCFIVLVPAAATAALSPFARVNACRTEAADEAVTAASRPIKNGAGDEGSWDHWLTDLGTIL